MRVALSEREHRAAIVVLAASLPASSGAIEVRYNTATGALARIDGLVAGAFDREHHTIVVPPAAWERELTLEVERESLPTNGLPPGRGWRRLVLRARSRERTSREIQCEPVHGGSPAVADRADPSVALWGHSHLDVAWLWTYDAAARKALRTFATAVALLDGDASFVFMQSQPQLYAFVRDGDAELFDRVRRLVAADRFDPDVAAMWVEPDCNLPSGESLVRQMLAARRFCFEAFGVEPSIAWLPDTFGFARTLPTLLAHAGIGCFATTKLQWNDTTRFPHPQFRWRGPDGAEVLAASIDRMDSDCTPERVRIARERHEPLIVGYGDGGGGPTRDQLERAHGAGHWERPRDFFARLRNAMTQLPVYDGELYLEYHRGVYTTHHDVKAENAALERELAAAEERAAWCVAVRVAPAALSRVREALRAAWEIVLRNQFHDVLPGTSIAEVYDDARAEYGRAHDLIAVADATMRAMLPRAGKPPAPARLAAPVAREGVYEFDNGLVRATVLPTGTIVELAAGEGGNVVAQANVLAVYRDRPKRWEAWNLDDGYQRTRRAARPGAPKLSVHGELEIPFDIAGSRATMRVALAENEPFLRVDLAVDWRERQRLLRVENWLTVETDEVVYGAPHGIVVRSARSDTPERRAQFEVPGQRFAAAFAAGGRGLAILALDTYGWNGRVLARGGLHLGHSLLRSTAWPDPRADAGEQRLCWAYAPLPRWSPGFVEKMWLDYACESSVRLFESAHEAVLVVACKPAEDGDGAILRVRECDGARRRARVRCGGRVRDVQSVDGLERAIPGDVHIEAESIAFEIGPFALRAFRVRF